MGLSNFAIAATALLASGSSASVITARATDSPYSNADSSLRFIYQNNLNATDDGNHIGAILLDPMTQRTGAKACAALGETLLSKSDVAAHASDFGYALSYQEYSDQVDGNQFLLADALLTAPQGGALSYSALPAVSKKFPILCTQSTNSNSVYTANSNNEVTVASNKNTFIGYRNKKSFRFSGIPYANLPGRFEYSTVYSPTGQTIQATAYGQNCAQQYDTSGGENCLFLNIQTPFIPKASSTNKKNLKPVLFSIHGGGFTGGNGGSGSGEDTGNLASREDIVGVEINYRLSTLGFLAIPGTNITGNYGIADQVTALQWVKANIASFGGDPDRVTIIGESAGAGSVRALLGSPPVIKNKLIAGAVAQSNLGGGKTLGLNGNYGTTYSSYYTIAQSYAVAGQNIFTAVGCTQATLAAQIACLKTVPAQTIVSASAVARYVVQDGTYVNTQQLIVNTKNSSTAHVPVIFGTTENDGASFSVFPKTPITSEVQGLMQGLYISQAAAQSIIDSGLFPLYSTGNLTLDTFNVTQRVATDSTFRCIDEATIYSGATSGAFSRAYYYTITRTYGGYDPNNLGAYGLSSGPGNNPELPYFKLHGADLGFTYGNQYPLRNNRDLIATQLISGYYAQFAKTGDPNPSLDYLNVRGYTNTSSAVAASGRWDPVTSATGPAKNLDYVSPSVVFPDLPQCAFLNYPITYYQNGGS